MYCVGFKRHSALVVPALFIAAVLLPSRSVPQEPQQQPDETLEQNQAHEMGHLPRTAEGASELAKRNGIKGVWTEVYHERGGEHFSSKEYEKLAYEPQPQGFRLIRPYVPYIWKFSERTIQSGPADKTLFPVNQLLYKLNPDGKADTLEVLDLDRKTGEPLVGARARYYLYALKDDFLIISAINPPLSARPGRSTTSAKMQNWVTILRRGKLDG